MSSSSSLTALDDHGQGTDVRSTLHGLHADDLVQLSQSEKGQGVSNEGFQHVVLRILRSYITFLASTWWHSMYSLLSARMTWLDRITILLFAVVASGIITILMAFCVLANIPLCVDLFEYWARTKADDLSLVNASYPQLFEALTGPQIDAARSSLAAPVSQSLSKPDHRVFDLDLARFLLQCASLMYERTSAPTRRAISRANTSSSTTPSTSGMNGPPHKEPGHFAAKKLGEDGVQRMMDQVHQSKGECEIQKWAETMHIKYATVSELNSTSSAFCGLFYDPNSTWIVLAFKGTSPTEFEEWASDFTYAPRPAGDQIRGFGEVHGGFFERLFPEEATDGPSPYETISKAVKVVAEHLLEADPTKEINVWFTGHSLGCAMSALAYARAVSESDFGDLPVRVRDAYLFAAPIVCDTASVQAFNDTMNAAMTRDEPCLRTMWRVTNRNDAVAVSLPSMGDDNVRESIQCLFNFAHLGVELKMGTNSRPSYVKGGTLDPDTWVSIRSKLDLRTVNAMNAQPVPLFVRRAQDIPLVGRLAAHGTTMYWDTITNLQCGRALWWQK